MNTKVMTIDDKDDKRWQEMTRDDKRWQEMTRDDKRWKEMSKDVKNIFFYQSHLAAISKSFTLKIEYMVSEGS